MNASTPHPAQLHQMLYHGKLLALPDGSSVILDYRNFSFEPASLQHMYYLCETRDWLQTMPGTSPSIYTVTKKFMPAFIRRIERPQHTFAHCFRRYKTEYQGPEWVFFYVRRNSIPVDITDILTYYRIEQKYSGGMYSSSSTTYHICDGCFGRHSGYGFAGAHYYEFVRGIDTLRAICLFFGIKQPRYLKGVDFKKSDAEVLVSLTRSCETGAPHPQKMTFSSN